MNVTYRVLHVTCHVTTTIARVHVTELVTVYAASILNPMWP